MKTTGIRTILATVLSLITVSVFATARLQIIHNSADKAAEKVDVWVNGSLLLDDFAFRTATPFIEAPAGDAVTVTIYPSNSNTTENPLWTNTYSLESGKNYIMIANGLISADGYQNFKPFNIDVYDMGQLKSAMGDNTDVLVFHGSTDAPAVDIREIGEGAGEIVSDASYGMFTGYLQLPTMDYVLEITDVNVPKVFATYQAPLMSLGLENTALVAVASGFLNPAANNNGPAFGVWVALPSGGELVELPVFKAGEARVQIIHNSPDKNAEMVDVYLNGEILLDDFMFRTATPFVSLPAGIALEIEIWADGASSTEKPLWGANLKLEDKTTYIMVANGLTTQSGYSTYFPFNVHIYKMGQESANENGFTDVMVYHGSTDAPAVDIREIGEGAGEIVSDASYGMFTGYLQLPTMDYVLEITDANVPKVFATYQAPLMSLGLENTALVAVASGFLNPAANNNGPAFGVWVALPSGGELVELPVFEAGEAMVQIIHNSPDILTEMVDVYLNGKLLLDDFKFRSATPFVSVPAGISLNISILDESSSAPVKAIYSNDFKLEDGQKYIIVASGVVNLEAYNPSAPFELNVYDMARLNSGMEGYTDVLVFHGSIDAPAVDVVETGYNAGTIVDDLAYGNFAGYLELPTNDYILDIRDASGTKTLGTWSAPLASLGLENSALVTVASGFLNNSYGKDKSFGLWVALPAGGNLIELPGVNINNGNARVQVIHNSADMAAQTVDVWLNDDLLLDDFSFRTASPFIDAPAGVSLKISIKDQNSTSPENPIWSNGYVLEDGKAYVLVANGIVSPSGYDPVQPFDIHVYDMGREMASNMNNTDILVFHGSTDAPTVDVFETGKGAGSIIDDLEYGSYQGYLELPTDDYILNIRDESGTSSVVSFSAPLATLGLDGTALVTVASGFLNPANNSNGAPFGLWVALPQGGNLVELPVFTEGTARVQVIHNSADLAAGTVDVWLNDDLLLDDFNFRTASPFIDAPSGINLKISIKDQNSTSPENPIWSNDYVLEDGMTYVLIANGIVSPSGYEPVQPFDIYVYDMGREMASDMNNTDVLVFHGSTDAPVVDIVETKAGAGTIIDDLAYGDFNGYLELPNADYVLAIRDESGSTTVASYSAPLNSLGLAGEAITVVASGFLSPSGNSNGPDFGLWVALPSGGELVPLSITLGVSEKSLIIDEFSVYPNPATNYLNIQYSVDQRTDVTVEVIDMLGSRVISEAVSGAEDIRNNITLDLTRLKGGMYFVYMRTSGETMVQKIQVAR